MFGELNSERSAEGQPTFRAVIRRPSELPEDAPTIPVEEHEFCGDDLSLDEIEAAYQQALLAADAAEAMVPEELGELPEELELAPVPPETDISFAPANSGSPRETDFTFQDPEDVPEIESSQVLEALLFVGGGPLSAKRLVDLLGGSHTTEIVDELLEALNRRYLAEGRPYEIQLIEGGYGLRLRDEFESVRRNVYGQGTKEVKLAQEALEVLAYVAYQQPVSREELDETGRQNIPAVLRQLLRRQLIRLDRGDEAGDLYRTTPRFLELFGLKSIDDLPRMSDFQFR